MTSRYTNKFSSLQEAILKFILEKKKEYEKKLAEYEKAGPGHKLMLDIGITSHGSVLLFFYKMFRLYYTCSSYDLWFSNTLFMWLVLI